MKKLNYIFLLLSACILYFTSCSDDYEAPENNLSDVCYYTSKTQDNTGIDCYFVSKGGYIIFDDASKGDISHKWIINSADSFLIDSPDFKAPLSPQIDTELADESTADIVTVLFNNVGKDSVILEDIFTDSVSYNGRFYTNADGDTISGGKLSTFKRDDVWVFRKTFKVDVFDDLKPACEIMDENNNVLKSFSATDLQESILPENYDTIQVDAGSPLYFIDKSSIGRPNSRLWTISETNPITSSKKVFENLFYLEGVYSGITLTSKRIANDSTPSGSAFVRIPIVIKVNKSNAPYCIFNSTPEDNKKVSQVNSNTLAFVTSGMVSQASLLEAANDFVVHVTNVNKGVDKNIVVSSAVLDSYNSMGLNLNLAEPIYEDDIVKVSYNGNKIKSIDGRVLENFIDEEVKMKSSSSNIMLDKDGNSYGGFEVEQTNNVAWCWWTGNATKVNFKRSTDFSASGEASCLVSGKKGITSGNPTLMTCKIDGDFYFNYGEGLYSLSMKVYVDPSVKNSGAKFYTLTSNNGCKLTWDLSDVKAGEWIELPAQKMVFLSKEKQFKLQIASSDIQDEFKFYVDDISLIKINSRP